MEAVTNIATARNDVEASFLLLKDSWKLAEPTLSKEIEGFTDHIDKTYKKQSDRILIHNALQLATVFHQRNEKPVIGDEDPKLRREEDYPGHKKLYISHPLAVASALAGKERFVPFAVGEEGEKQSLAVRQQPLRAEIVAAALLHDVVEDVRFKGEEGEDLLVQIREHLGNDRRAEKIVRIVNAVTHETVESLTEPVVRAIKDSSLFRSMKKEFRTRQPGKDEAKIDHQLIRTIADIHKLFAASFPDPKFPSAEDYDVFFSAFAVKCHDIENNLETKTRDDKLMRAHLFAVMARTMDFPVASRLALHLVADQDYSIFGGTNTGDDERRLGAQYIQKENERPKKKQRIYLGPPAMRELTNGIEVTSLQIPLLTAGERARRGLEPMKPVLQYKVELKKGALLLAQKVSHERSIPAGLGAEDVTLHKMDDALHADLRSVGRNLVYYEARAKKGSVVAIIRCNDTEPTVHDAVKLKSRISVADIKERRLLRRFDGTIGSTLKILERFSPLPKYEEAA